ncbi:MAG: DUF4276 family protein [Bacteroidales bacterium]|jgi:hypothetical protein|nr:DUF4276 family protein [Bacteroidales bacterium]
MTRLEFLLEEPSMESFLKGFLPKILPEGYVYNGNYFLRPHQGKSDLLKSIPRKIKTNYGEDTIVIILHDQDSNNCVTLKQKIDTICQNNCASNNQYLIRIVCRELESWYLGDLNAVKQAFPKFNATTYQNKAKFRNPDLLNAANELTRLLPEFQKNKGAKLISQHIDIKNNKSISFQQFVTGLQKILQSINT